MSKIVIILFLFSINIFADKNYELKLYEKVLPLIFSVKSLVVYTDLDTKSILQPSDIFILTDDCEKANILIGKKFDNLHNSCNKKPIFARSYKSLKNMKNSFGAFYWRKGRPQIRFKQEEIEKLHLYIPSSLKRYVE